MITSYAEAMLTDPPRLVISYAPSGAAGGDSFAWKIIGKGVSILSLIGYMTRVQTELAGDREVYLRANPCEDRALVVAWDEHRKAFDWYVHADIPPNGLLGMLEMVRQTLVAVEMQRAAASKSTGLVLPNGRPIPRG